MNATLLHLEAAERAAYAADTTRGCDLDHRELVKALEAYLSADLRINGLAAYYEASSALVRAAKRCGYQHDTCVVEWSKTRVARYLNPVSFAVRPAPTPTLTQGGCNG